MDRSARAQSVGCRDSFGNEGERSVVTAPTRRRRIQPLEQQRHLNQNTQGDSKTHQQEQKHTRTTATEAGVA